LKTPFTKLPPVPPVPPVPAADLTIVFQSGNMPSFEEIEGQIQLIAAEWAVTLMEGAYEDVHVFATTITSNLMGALSFPPHDRERRDAVIRECILQFSQIAELNRVRSSRANMLAFSKIMEITTLAAISVLLAAVGGITALPVPAVSALGIGGLFLSLRPNTINP